ncbi:MAG: bis(5'-nucleosyl)-tetraphosphatase (symmetrical) YqeK [Brevinemataceae bacterium]
MDKFDIYQHLLTHNMQYSPEILISLLNKLLSEKRFHHVLRVRDTAVHISNCLQIDEPLKYRVVQAVLFHDFAKGMSSEQLFSYAQIYNINLDNIVPSVYHAVVGAWMMEKFFGICDTEISMAVYYHTTGHPDFVDNMIGTIVFLADYLEPGREISTEHITQWIPHNLNNAAFEVVKDKIISVIRRNLELSSESLAYYHCLRLQK